MSNKPENNNGNQITMAVLVLAVLLAFVVGLMAGYFIGEHRAESRIGTSVLGNIGTTNNGNGGGNSGNGDDINESIDYSQFVINSKLGVTVENYFSDAETKEYVVKALGMDMPTINWTKSDGTAGSTADFNGDYVVEIFSPTCYYCNQTIAAVDEFRANHPDYNIVSVTTESGDLSAFNENGENAFYWEPANADEAALLDHVPWIPCFMYVHEGKVMLVTYGQETVESIEQAWQVAFDR